MNESLMEMVQHRVWAAPETHVHALLAARRNAAAQQPQPLAQEANGPVIVAGVAVVRVQGMIWPKENIFTRWLGDVALDRFRAQVRALASDPNVSAILLDVDSPGGIAEGLAETAEVLRQVRTEKRLLAVANAFCASAAYYLASQATPGDLVVVPDGKIGSVGTYILHVEFSKALENEGITVNIIRNPDRKARYSELEPLDEQARARLQTFADETTIQFQADVAKGRGISAAKVAKDFGQGDILLPKEAVAVGMADRIATMEQVLAKLVSRKGGVKAEQPSLSAGEEPAQRANSPAGLSTATLAARQRQLEGEG